jgi:hypothetical protein
MTKYQSLPKVNKLVEPNTPRVHSKDPDFWFKQRKYGYGYRPYTREGWFLTLLYILLVFVSIKLFANDDTKIFVAVGLLTIILLVASIKNGEKRTK